jgi:hypothetical protein
MTSSSQSLATVPSESRMCLGRSPGRSVGPPNISSMMEKMVYRPLASAFPFRLPFFSLKNYTI